MCQLIRICLICFLGLVAIVTPTNAAAFRLSINFQVKDHGVPEYTDTFKPFLCDQYARFVVTRREKYYGLEEIDQDQTVGKLRIFNVFNSPGETQPLCAVFFDDAEWSVDATKETQLANIMVESITKYVDLKSRNSKKAIRLFMTTVTAEVDKKKRILTLEEEGQSFPIKLYIYPHKPNTSSPPNSEQPTTSQQSDNIRRFTLSYRPGTYPEFARRQNFVMKLIRKLRNAKWTFKPKTNAFKETNAVPCRGAGEMIKLSCAGTTCEEVKAANCSESEGKTVGYIVEKKNKKSKTGSFQMVKKKPRNLSKVICQVGVDEDTEVGYPRLTSKHINVAAANVAAATAEDGVKGGFQLLRGVKLAL